MALTIGPTSVLTKIPPHLFRVVLLRRLRLRCPSMRAGVAVQSIRQGGCVGRRVCREAGGRVTTNVMVRDLDFPAPDAADGRRLESVDGLPGHERWCALSAVMGPPTEAPLRLMVWFSPERGGGESRGTQSWWVLAVARALSCWPWRRGEGASGLHVRGRLLQ